jgi:putative solute:sodium symporter small subunit
MPCCKLESNDEANPLMADVNQTERWRETGILAAITLGVSLVVILLFLAFAEPSGGASAYPTGFILAATGLPIVLVLIVFWFVRRQEVIDRRHGLFED